MDNDSLEIVFLKTTEPLCLKMEAESGSLCSFLIKSGVVERLLFGLNGAISLPHHSATAATLCLMIQA